MDGQIGRSHYSVLDTFTRKLPAPAGKIYFLFMLRGRLIYINYAIKPCQMLC